MPVHPKWENIHYETNIKTQINHLWKRNLYCAQRRGNGESNVAWLIVCQVGKEIQKIVWKESVRRPDARVVEKGGFNLGV